MSGDQFDQRDDDLLARLRECLDLLPLDLPPGAEPPPSVLEGAVWVHDWLNMDAELAELTFDSTEQLELAGTRSMGSLRALTFVSGTHTIEIEIEPGPRTVEVSGTIHPPVAGKVQLVVGGEVFAGDIDDMGSFGIRAIAHGTVLAFVDTSAGKIRLGSFEV
jgi:hypothetical protein